MVPKDAGCYEMCCTQCSMHFCYECGASGEDWKRTHYSIPNPSKYRCPPTEERRAREGFTKDEADRRVHFIYRYTLCESC